MATSSVAATSLRLGGAQTIDEVIAQMDQIIAWALAEKSRLGYFAALYRKVTVQVRAGIHNGAFEDNARMERLDVIFANRYLDALGSYLRGELPSNSWMAAFEASRSGQPIILQHLLLGMNAHINLDLGIAAAEVCPGAQIDSLHNDFMSINAILASLVDEVRSEIDDLSPWIDLLDNISPKASDAIVNFSMEKARDSAWGFARRLAPLTGPTLRTAIQRKDHEVAFFAKVVAKPPGFLFRIGLWVIGLRESRNIRRNIEVLNQDAAAPAPVTGTVAL